MATLDDNDLKAIKDLIEATVEEVIDRNGVATKDHIGNLATKDEFYGTMDKVMGELKAIREEVAILGHQVSEHTDRLDRIESNQDCTLSEHLGQMRRLAKVWIPSMYKLYCGQLQVVQAPLLQGVSLDVVSFCEHLLRSAKIDICGGKVV